MTFTRTFEVAVAVDPVTLAYGRPWVQGLTVTEAITPRSTRATKRRLLPDIALAVRSETGSSLGHLGVGSMAGQVADAAAQYPALGRTSRPPRQSSTLARKWDCGAASPVDSNRWVEGIVRGFGGA